MNTTISPQDQARILSEALPHMQRYDEETIVVKYGGHAMGNEEVARAFARDIVLLEQTAINPVVVHGGGPQIEAMLKKAGVQSQFAGGLRVTDKATLEIVEMVLAGSINKQIVGYINAAGGKAIGLCGKDGNMVMAKKATRRVVDPDSNIEKVVDLGFVGEPDKVDLTVLNVVLGRELIPVLAPVCAGADGSSFNVNADTFAGAIAGALKAKRFLLLTDVPGVLDKNKKLIEKLSAAEVRSLIADGTISGGMIPKVETCLYALEQGVEGVVILDGKVPHAVLLELFTDHGAGTLIYRYRMNPIAHSRESGHPGPRAPRPVPLRRTTTPIAWHPPKPAARPRARHPGRGRVRHRRRHRQDRAQRRHGRADAVHVPRPVQRRVHVRLAADRRAAGAAHAAAALDRARRRRAVLRHRVRHLQGDRADAGAGRDPELFHLPADDRHRGVAARHGAARLAGAGGGGRRLPGAGADGRRAAGRRRAGGRRLRGRRGALPRRRAADHARPSAPRRFRPDDLVFDPVLDGESSPPPRC